MSQAEAPETAGEHGSGVPVLFPENTRAQEAFGDIAAALIADPALYRKPVSADIKNALEWIVGYLDPEFLDKKAKEWLFSEEHFYVSHLGFKNRHSKLGRLGGVIAMHPRRDEIATLITPDMVKEWGKYLPPPFLPHISRLLTHTNAQPCEDFAIEFLRHPEFWEETPGNADGNGAFTFWTYAPYVLTHLKQKGASLTELMTNWCMRRKRIGRSGDARYPGIEHMYDGVSRYHYLKQDGQSPSHAFVSYIAEKAIVPALT